MLRVGLTGGVGSGKSTAGKMLAEWGAHVLDSDAIGRAMMEPGHPVYGAIVERFGEAVVCADGRLNRNALARIGFTEGRIEELNAIVHPAVIARQAEMMREIGEREPGAVCVVESALIFETRHGDGIGGDWRSRFDRIILVTAPEEVRLARFVLRGAAGKAVSEEQQRALNMDGRRRMARQMNDAAKAADCDYVIENAGTLDELQRKLRPVWDGLRREASASTR